MVAAGARHLIEEIVVRQRLDQRHRHVALRQGERETQADGTGVPITDPVFGTGLGRITGVFYIERVYHSRPEKTRAPGMARHRSRDATSDRRRPSPISPFQGRVVRSGLLWLVGISRTGRRDDGRPRWFWIGSRADDDKLLG